jgi:hypothetical protein
MLPRLSDAEEFTGRSGVSGGETPNLTAGALRELEA